MCSPSLRTWRTSGTSFAEKVRHTPRSNIRGRSGRGRSAPPKARLYERNLSNARSFLVNFTRQRSDLRLFTDDREKLIKQVESNRGDKTSALETIGELQTEKTLAKDAADAWNPGPVPDEFGMPGETRTKTEDRFGMDFASADAAKDFADIKGFDNDNAEDGKANGKDSKHGQENATGKTPDKTSDPFAPRKEEPQLDRSKGLEL